MALGPVWASIWPNLTTSWARAGAAARAPATASTAMSSRPRFMYVSSTLRDRVRRAAGECAPDTVVNCRSERKTLGDDLLHDLGGAGGDGPQAHVAEEALHGELAHVAVAAVELHGLVGDAVCHLGGEELGHGDLGDAVRPFRVEGGRVIQETARGHDFRGHLRHAMAQRLLLAQRPVEGVALAQVDHGVLESLPGPGEREHAGHDALALKSRRELLEAATFHAEQVLGRDRAVLEGQLGGIGGAHAHLVELAAHHESREPALDEEHGDAVVAAIGRARVRAGGHEVQIAVHAVRDEDLAAREEIAIALLHRAGGEVRHVRPRAGLRDAEGTHDLALDDSRQVAALLRLVAEARQPWRGHIGVHEHAESDAAGAAARHLLAQHNARKEVTACPAVVHGELEAEEPQLAQAPPERLRNLSRDFPLVDVRHDLLLYEGAHALPQHLMLLTEHAYPRPSGERAG